MNLYLRLLWLRLTARYRGRLGLWDVASTPFRVLPTDLDLLGHVNNGRYLTIMDLARIDLLVRSGVWAQMVRRGWYPVVGGQTIQYRRSLKLGQRFTVVTRLLGHDERSWYLEQDFLVGEELCARAVVRTRFLRRAGGAVPHADLEEVAGPAPLGREVAQWVLDWARDSRVKSSSGDRAA